MTRRRAVKVYGTIGIVKPDTPPAKAHHLQIRLIVAAHSQREAADLMDMSVADFRWSGGETGNAREIEVALGEPGRVFWSDLDAPPSHANWRPWTGQEAAAVKRAERAVAAEEHKARVAELHAYHERQRQHRAETEEAIAAALDRLRPLLAALDIHPATVVMGEDTERGQRLGVLLPAEAVERLVKLATLADELSLEG